VTSARDLMGGTESRRRGGRTGHLRKADLAPGACLEKNPRPARWIRGATLFIMPREPSVTRVTCVIHQLRRGNQG